MGWIVLIFSVCLIYNIWTWWIERCDKQDAKAQNAIDKTRWEKNRRNPEIQELEKTLGKKLMRERYEDDPIKFALQQDQPEDP